MKGVRPPDTFTHMLSRQRRTTHAQRTSPRLPRRCHSVGPVNPSGPGQTVRESVSETPVEIAALVREVSTAGKLVE
jgi:hypothetical protein